MSFTRSILVNSTKFSRFATRSSSSSSLPSTIRFNAIRSISSYTSSSSSVGLLLKQLPTRTTTTDRKQSFATSSPFAEFLKSDASLDKAQEYLDEGVSFQNNNMIPMAMSSFQRSLNEHPTAAAHYNMGVCYFQLGDFRSCIVSFQESLKLSPHHADVHTNLATAHIKLDNDLDAAWRHLEAATTIDPSDAEIQFNFAVVSEQLGKFESAIGGYTAAVELGIEVAKVNLRNVSAKRLAAVAAKKEEELAAKENK